VAKLRAKLRELKWALEGTLTAEQRWLLQQELQQVEGIDRKTAWSIVA
jgi:hypothetical protein